tara:strand:+ start:868 stop:1428 length:561 start_codon:yes stop_codon:yes gene_type:complete
MSCKLTVSKTNSCSKKAKQGGLDTTMWLFNLEEGGEITAYTEAVEGVVTGITLPTGATLKRVDTEKYANSFSHSFERPSLNSFFPQIVNIVAITDDAADLQWYVETLRADKLGAIVKDTNGQFKILGQYAGLRGNTGDGYSSGNEQGAEVGSMILLDGAETTHPFKFLDLGSTKLTQDYLQSLEAV